jgi:hypothetical protein
MWSCWNKRDESGKGIAVTFDGGCTINLTRQEAKNLVRDLQEQIKESEGKD